MISLFNKFKVAFLGLTQAIKDKSIRIQMLIGFCVLIFGIGYRFTSIEWLWIFSCIVLVILSEMFNTCIEKVCDLIDSNHNKKIKYIKDLSSGCVLLASIYSIVIGCFILKGVIK